MRMCFMGQCEREDKIIYFFCREVRFFFIFTVFCGICANVICSLMQVQEGPRRKVPLICCVRVKVVGVVQMGSVLLHFL